MIQERRRRIWDTYAHELGGWAAAHGIRLPVIPDHCQQAYHMFYLLLPDLEARQRLISNLKAQGILSVFHYLPLHLSEMGRRLGGVEGACPVTEAVSDRLLRLPFYTGLGNDDQQRVIEAVLAFRP